MPEPRVASLVFAYDAAVAVAWACRDPYSASLRAIPEGKNRRTAYCRHCRAATCLFGGSVADRQGQRARKRNWAMPDWVGWDDYMWALRRYVELLGVGHTCWRCANLRKRLREGRPQYACGIALRRAADDGLRARGSSSPVSRKWLPASEMQLRTAAEACHGAWFEPRSGPVPDVGAGTSLAEMARLCSSCVHLRRVTGEGKVRFLCLEQAKAEGTAWGERILRSWRTWQWRRGKQSWCAGALWQHRQGDVAALGQSELPVPKAPTGGGARQSARCGRRLP